MTARKKTARKKSIQRKANPKGLLHAADRELAQLSKRFDRRMVGLGRGIQKAEREAGREAAKLLHQARAKLDKMNVRGSSDWDKFLRDTKRDLSRTLGKLERSVRPQPVRKKKTAKKTPRKKTTRKKAS